MKTETITVKSHKRTTRKAKATREYQYGNLPIRKEVIPLSEEDKQCPYRNSLMEYVNIKETFWNNLYGISSGTGWIPFIQLAEAGWGQR